MTSSVYNYQNDARVWLPMTAACHDPANVRTLDVSASKGNYRFGDGVTANTFPAKVSGQRGYTFNASTTYLEALANQTNAITQGTWAVMFYIPYNLGTYDILSHFDATGTTRAILIVTNTPTIAFYCGDATFSANISTSIAGRVNFAAGYRTTDGYRRLYFNGLLAAPNNTGTTLPGAPTTLPRIGRRYNGGNPMPGKVYWHGAWDYALSEIQLRDLEARLRRELNDV